MTQSTQYDDFASSWKDGYSGNTESQAKTFPAALLEEAQLKAALLQATQRPKEDLPDLPGKHVLDLAAGAGHYSRIYLKWGAASVTGVDISPGMIDEARAEAKRNNDDPSKLRFEVGDATNPTNTVKCSHTPDGLFDMVTASWLLNYASNTADMTAMFETVSRHLRPGGFFVGLTIPPLAAATGNEEQDAKTLAAEAVILNAQLNATSGAHASYGESGHVVEQVKDGLKVRINLWELQKGEARSFGSFDNYYLRESVYADAIRDTKAFENDELVWQQTTIPEDLYSQLESLGRTRGFWNSAKLRPWTMVCAARRKLL